MRNWHRRVTAEESAAILRLHHVEGWPVGTIGTELGRHHDTVEGVLAHTDLGVHKASTRTRPGSSSGFVTAVMAPVG